MKNLFIAIAFVALLASPVMATIYETGSGPISVTCNIAAYAQVIWQDNAIAFSDANDGTGDWWNDTALEGYAYNALPKGSGDPDEVKASTDPWAGYSDGVWYESRDDADIYVHSNVDLNMTVADNGPLTSGSDTLPTWFTLAAYGNAGSAIIGGSPYSGSSSLPGGTNTGTFLYNSGSRSLGYGNSSYEYPTQDAMPLDNGGDYTAVLAAETDATLTFHVRIHRNGLSDPSGNYSTTIGVTFSE
jgi:hypothetical protein